jgi:hypothetical protein
MELEHEADLPVAEGCQLFFVPGENIRSVEQDFARRRMVESPQDMHQGALSRSGDAQDGHRLPGGDGEIHFLEDLDPLPVFDKRLFQVSNFNHGDF